MVGLNKMMVIGNVGTDPDMRYTPNGNPVTSFRLATGRTYTTSDGERRQDTEWFTVVAWNQLAEQCNQFLAKGRRVFVEGRLKSHSWTGTDGQTRFRNEIVANRVLFLDRGAQAEGAPEAAETDAEADAVREASESDAEELPW
jgi:single-strand DNA-binding protein